MTDTSNRLIIFDEAVFECYGRVKTWIYYSDNNVEWKPGIWRQTSGNYYKLIGENIVPGSSSGYTEYEVPEAERVRFQPGDQIGYRHATPALKYDQGLDSVPFHYVDTSDYSTVFDPGLIKTVASTGERAYSVKAGFEDEGMYNICEDYNTVRNDQREVPAPNLLNSPPVFRPSGRMLALNGPWLLWAMSDGRTGGGVTFMRSTAYYYSTIALTYFGVNLDY